MTLPTGFPLSTPRWTPRRHNGVSEGSSAEVLSLLHRLVAFSQATEVASALDALSASHRHFPRQPLAENFNRLSSAHRSALERHFSREWRAFLSLAEERDPVIFSEGLLELARRRSERDPTGASILFSLLAGEGELGGISVTREARRQAEAELRTLRGEGGWGRRLELAARNFSREVTDPGMLLAMTAGGLVYSGARAFGLSRLLARGPGLLTRGWGARTLAGAAAFPAEVAAFWGTYRLYGQALHPDRMSWDSPSVSREILGTGLTLGFLKLGGAASQGLLHRTFGASAANGTAIGFSARTARGLFPQAGMFAGITAGHWAEIQLGWRPPQSTDSLLIDSLVTLAQFNVAGRLSHQILGPRYAAFLQGLNARGEQMAAGPSADSAKDWFNPSLATTGMRMPLPLRGRAVAEFIPRPLLMAGPPRGNKGRPASTVGAPAIAPAPVTTPSWDPTNAIKTLLDVIRANREFSVEQRVRVAAELYPHLDRVTQYLRERMEMEVRAGLPEAERLTSSSIESITHRIRRSHFEEQSDQLRLWYEKYRYLQEELFRRINKGSRGKRRITRRLQDHVWRKVWETRRFHHEAESYLGDDKGPGPKSSFSAAKYPALAQRYADILQRLENYVVERKPLAKLLRGFNQNIPSRYQAPVAIPEILSEAQALGLTPETMDLFRSALHGGDPILNQYHHSALVGFLRSLPRQPSLEKFQESLMVINVYLTQWGDLVAKGIPEMEIADRGAIYMNILDRGSGDPEAFRRELENAWAPHLGPETSSRAGNYLNAFRGLYDRIKSFRPNFRDTMQIEWPEIRRQLQRLGERNLLDARTVAGLLEWLEAPRGLAKHSLIFSIREGATAGIIDFLSNAEAPVREEVARFLGEVIRREDEKMIEVLAIRFHNYQMGMMRDRVQIRANPSDDPLTNQMAIEEYDRFLAALVRTARFYNQHAQARGFFLDIFDKLEWDRADSNHELAIAIWLRSEELLKEGYRVDLFSRGGAGEAVLSAVHPEKGGRTIAITSVLNPLGSRQELESWIGRAERELVHNGIYQRVGNGSFPRLISLHLPRLRSGVSKDSVIQWAGDYLKDRPLLSGIHLYIPTRGNEVADLSDPSFYRRVEVDASNVPSTEALIEDRERDVRDQPMNLAKRWELYRLRRSHYEYLEGRAKVDRPMFPSPAQVAEFNRAMEEVSELKRQNWELLRDTAKNFPKEKGVQTEYQRLLLESFQKISSDDLNYLSDLSSTQWRQALRTALSDRIRVFQDFLEMATGIRLIENRLTPMIDLANVDAEVRDFTWEYKGKGIVFRGSIVPVQHGSPDVGEEAAPPQPPGVGIPVDQSLEPENGTFHFSIIRPFHKETTEIQFDHVTLPKALRGGGIGRHFMGELIRLGEDIGATRIVSPEISEDGRYKLAIYGMQFRDRNERNKMVHFFKIFLEHQSRIPGMEGFDLSALEKIRNPQQIAHAHLDPQTKSLVLTRRRGPHEWEAPPPIPAHYLVGQAYLLNASPSWAGIMDLGPDSIGLKIFNEYFMDREMGRLPPENVEGN